MKRVVVDIFNFRDVLEKSDLGCIEWIDLFLLDIVRRCDFTVVRKIGHQFKDPWGVTWGFILSESHIIFSTYLEDNHASLSIEHCKDFDEKILEKFLQKLKLSYKITKI